MIGSGKSLGIVWDVDGRAEDILARGLGSRLERWLRKYLVRAAKLGRISAHPYNVQDDRAIRLWRRCCCPDRRRFG